MSVLLFNSPLVRQRKDELQMGNVYPRISIASLAAYLIESNVKVHIIDPMAHKLDEKGVKERIAALNPSVVGISAFTEEVHDAAYTASLVKDVNQEIATVVGGPHSSAMPVETLEEFPQFDIAAFGEGEDTLLEIAQGRPLEKIRGISYRKGKSVKLNAPRTDIRGLDSLPFPAWQLFDLDAYRGKSLSSGFGKRGGSLELQVESARGCPFNCIFCYRIAGKNIRFKSPKRVADEVERAVKFGANKIHFVEGTFGVDRKLAEEMCDELIRRGVNKKITWSSGGRANVVTKQLLKKMKDSGCRYLGFGVESGVQELLDVMGKDITLEEIERAFDMCRKIGIEAEAEFIIGHPYETEETVLRTIWFAKRLKANHATFAIMVPFPGTEVRRMAEKGTGGLRILSNDWRIYGKQIGGTLELDQLPLEKLRSLQAKAYKDFYFTPARIGKLAGRLSLKRIAVGIRRLVS